MPKYALKFMSSHLTVFTIAKPKIEISLWNWMCVACMLLSNIYFGFHCSQILGLIGIHFFEKSRFWVGDENRKISEIWGGHFGMRSVLRLSAFFDCALLQACTFYKHSNIYRFLTKIGETWRHLNITFSKHSRRIFLNFWYVTQVDAP